MRMEHEGLELQQPHFFVPQTLQILLDKLLVKKGKVNLLPVEPPISS